jgi:AcrR family transcriptional regulator
MPQPALDHRRATAERNAAAIVDAAERLLASGATLSMASVAAEAKVSRPTLYAHFSNLGVLVEAAVERAIEASLSTIHGARPDEGPADEALRRMIAASWSALARQDAIARAAAEHLSTARLHTKHAAVLEPLQRLVARGQAEGTIRDDPPTDWLVRTFITLVHAADDHARARAESRAQMLEHLETTIFALFAVR